MGHGRPGTARVTGSRAIISPRLVIAPGRGGLRGRTWGRTHPDQPASARRTPAGTPAPATRPVYRLLLMKGLTPTEAANLTAFMCGLPTTRPRTGRSSRSTSCCSCARCARSAASATRRDGRRTRHSDGTLPAVTSTSSVDFARHRIRRTASPPSRAGPRSTSAVEAAAEPRSRRRFGSCEARRPRRSRGGRRRSAPVGRPRAASTKTLNSRSKAGGVDSVRSGWHWTPNTNRPSAASSPSIRSPAGLLAQALATRPGARSDGPDGLVVVRVDAQDAAAGVGREEDPGQSRAGRDRGADGSSPGRSPSAVPGGRRRAGGACRPRRR